MAVPVHYRWITGLVLVLLVSCRAPQDDDPEIIVTLDPEFTVDLFEQRAASDGKPTFGLWVESMEEFECSNYQIEATVEVDAGMIDIQLQEIRPPDTCMGAPGPARGFLPIGQLADGTYPFRFALNQIIQNEGFLLVQNGHYELNLPNQQGIDFQNRVLEALPDGYVWGYANTPSESDLPVADQFIQNLKGLTQDLDLPTGFYSYFTVAGTGQFYFHRSIAPEGQHRPFLRRLSGPPNAVKSLLQGYRDDPGQPLSILCLSTFGAL